MIASPRWRGKRSCHPQRISNSQFHTSGKMPMQLAVKLWKVTSDIRPNVICPVILFYLWLCKTYVAGNNLFCITMAYTSSEILWTISGTQWCPRCRMLEHGDSWNRHEVTVPNIGFCLCYGVINSLLLNSGACNVLWNWAIPVHFLGCQVRSIYESRSCVFQS